MKKARQKKYEIQILNLKLLSNNRQGTEAYIDIFKEIFSKKIAIPVKGGKHAILRTQFTTEINGKIVLYGKFSKFTKIDGKDWFDIENMEIVSYEIPKHIFPNIVESDYIFIPDAHRFVIIKSININVLSPYTFFEKALENVINIDEDYEVIIEQSIGIYEEILHAHSISSLEISISYSNSDIYEEAEAFMDTEIRIMKAKRFKLSVIPDHQQQISLDSKILNGAMGVARSNGEVKAVIRDENNVKKTIITKQHPETIPILVSNEDELKNTIFAKIMNMFRNDS